MTATLDLGSVIAADQALWQGFEAICECGGRLAGTASVWHRQKKPIQTALLEPRPRGRWLEISEDGKETSVATIMLWEPPHCLVMVWQVNAQLKLNLTMTS